MLLESLEDSQVLAQRLLNIPMRERSKKTAVIIFLKRSFFENILT